MPGPLSSTFSTPCPFSVRQLIVTSPVAGQYDTPIDRESAYEVLGRRVATRDALGVGGKGGQPAIPSGRQLAPLHQVDLGRELGMPGLALNDEGMGILALDQGTTGSTALVVDPDGKVVPDLDAKLPGRGHYLAPERAVVERHAGHPQSPQRSQ